MNFYSRSRSWLRAISMRSRREDEMNSEMAFHMESHADELVRTGIPREEALRRARLEFGAIESAKDECRQSLGVLWWDEFWDDLRFGSRMLRKNSGFTAMAVLSLALGIGANTAIFTLIDQVVLKWLPVPDPEQLVELSRFFPIPFFEQFAARNRSFTAMYASDKGPMSASIDGESQIIRGKFVSGSYSSTMGLDALLGRSLTAEDDQPGKPLVCTLTYGFWQRRFASSPGVLGKTIAIKGIPFTIVGVTREVDRGVIADILIPMVTHSDLAMKDNTDVAVGGRLKPGITDQQAAAELTVIYQQTLAEASGSALTSEKQRQIMAQKIELRPAARGGTHEFSSQLRIIAAVVGLVLLIACANVANLLLARGSARYKEFAVRLALGAGRNRLVRQLLTESLLLGILAGGLGLLLALSCGHLLSTLVSEHPVAISADRRILGFTMAISLLTSLFFGAVPAFRATQVDLEPALKAGARSSKPTWRQSGKFPLGKSLAVAQIGWSLVLLIASGLLIRTLHNLQKVDVGFNRDVLLMWTFPTMTGYEVSRERSLYRQALDKLNAIPGVQSASLSRFQLFSGYWRRQVFVPGYTPASDEEMGVSCNPIAPRFFATMGIPLLFGRDITPADTTNAPKVAVISESMARQYFPKQNPIGRHFRFAESGSAGEIEVVGVVRDILSDFREQQRGRSPRAAYIPYTQAPSEATGQAVFEVRLSRDLPGVADEMRSAVLSVDKNLPLGDIYTQNDVVLESLGSERSLTELTASFGLLALLLSSIGLYGSISYSVVQRTKEIGIRMALGAAPRKVFAMVLGEGLLLTSLGIGIGLAFGAAVRRLIASQLYGLSVMDPATLVSISASLVAIALLATYVPARRAMKVDPIVALHYE